MGQREIGRINKIGMDTAALQRSGETAVSFAATGYPANWLADRTFQFVDISHIRNKTPRLLRWDVAAYRNFERMVDCRMINLLSVPGAGTETWASVDAGLEKPIPTAEDRRRLYRDVVHLEHSERQQLDREMVRQARYKRGVRFACLGACAIAAGLLVSGIHRMLEPRNNTEQPRFANGALVVIFSNLAGVLTMVGVSMGMWSSFLRPLFPPGSGLILSAAVSMLCDYQLRTPPG